MCCHLYLPVQYCYSYLWYCVNTHFYLLIMLPLISGLIVLAAIAIPEVIPPPLTGTNIASSCGTCFKNSTAIVP